MDYSFKYTKDDDFDEYSLNECEAMRFMSNVFAKRIMEGDTDKLGEPIIKHCRRVAIKAESIVKGLGIRDYKICTFAYVVGMLHDIIEDYGYYETTLYAVFGKSVGDAVLALTRYEHDPYMEYIDWLSDNPIACIVKLADLSDNLSLDRLWQNCPVDRYTKAYVKLYKRLCKEREAVCLTQ